MSSRHPTRCPRHALSLRAVSAVSAAVALAALTLATSAGAVDLSFSSYAQAYGYINTQYTSPLLGDVSFTLNGPSDYKDNYKGSGRSTTGVASMTYEVAAGQGGADPVYDIVTSNGQYGLGYSGQAEVFRTDLRTRTTTTTVDTLGQLASSPNSNVQGFASAQWQQQMFIGATAARPTGSYGAILISFTLDGNFPALSDPAVQNSGYAYGSVSTSFVDTAGVSYQSSFGLYTGASDPSWTGSNFQFKKLLFQYGTVFSLNLWQYAGANTNGNADFFSTGYISSMELPFEATLESGAQQAGLGSLAQLYGNVSYSATADDINTNWDFGSNGGGFNPPVPEAPTVALMLAGLAAMGFVARRRRRR